MIRRMTSILVLITTLIVTTAFGNDPVFSEYKTKEFTFKGHDAKIVFPTKKNPNNYWIWRARFWGHEPQVDKALLEKGFHVVYVDVSDLFGNHEAVKLWNDFYDFCVAEYGLNRKVVLEGMSRGGLIVYNWASKNTDKVFCIYADAPVCDIKSWPGGMYNGKGSPEAWKACLEAYNLDTISVKTFEDMPVNNCVQVAEAGIPVMHVYGDADVVVPYEENTALLAEKFRSAGGSIELIGKEGVGHHPHCLKDPSPIVDFILNSVEYKE
ncbi:prolyl oligopeptidase family serine peptidase [Maribellus sp. CM-23]|uniref:alpha/beta hydrolase family protein n=1 Tax=Maribellus sp. CM-23 TaxID=2781026 RepID=UPI001F16BBC0|nr:prolyl oligopeptidase family serine peptidase [Maribellus sp. CM-23]MCE4565173.1 prolyl oligopeptidase family serine peptidase [Maribellus sp. CM-23]